MKIGIMGGTFNPIHNAHLYLAKEAYRQFGLDEVIFLPSKKPPHKPNDEIVSDEARVTMISMMIEGYDYFSLSTMELEREGTTYTVDTLEELKRKHPEIEYYFIIGGDSLSSFSRWKNPKRILELTNIIACGRDKVSEAVVLEEITRLRSEYGGNVTYLKIEDLDISSTRIRSMIKNNMSLKDYVPYRVEQYIYDNQLYK